MYMLTKDLKKKRGFTLVKKTIYLLKTFVKGMKLVLLFVIVVLSVTDSTNAEKIPKPEFINPYERNVSKTLDQTIAETMGGIDIASNMILDDDGKILAELDMYLSQKQFLDMYEPPTAKEMYKMGLMSAPVGVVLDDTYFSQNTQQTKPRLKRKAARTTTLRWTNNVIPYIFLATHFDTKEEYMIRRSMTEWERYTCMQFRPATSRDKNLVRFQGGGGCNSQLGMIGGTQDLNLEYPGCRFKGLYLHEIGHAIGLVHEHQLPNRDDFITINYENVQPRMRLWFNKYTIKVVDQMNVPYEYSSVMHYGLTAFSVDGKKRTIGVASANKDSEEEIGETHMKELSYTDVQIVNLMYNCSSHCPQPDKCGSEGHLDQNCECICQDGSSDCDKTKFRKADPSCVNQFNGWKCYIWANQGECERNSAFMTRYCRKACGQCDTQQSPNGRVQDSCRDFYLSNKCLVWKSRGDCLTNSAWMRRNCQSACGLCGDSAARPEVNCSNLNQEGVKCDDWAKVGECTVNAKFMFKNCRKSCAMCQMKEEDLVTSSKGIEEEILKCEDKYRDCPLWATTNLCQTNPRVIINDCRKSCQKCDDGTCKNLYDDDQCDGWAKSLECLHNFNWMGRFCAKACGRGPCQGKNNQTVTSSVTDKTRQILTTQKPVTLSTTTGVPVSCKNLHKSESDCESWAKHNQCSINPRWMLKNCYKSCSGCNGGVAVQETTTLSSGFSSRCEDVQVECPNWAKHGYCDSNPTYALRYCKKSCNNCNGCQDNEVLCSVWARDGHCQRNPNFMMRSCQKSCQACKLSDDAGDSGATKLRPSYWSMQLFILNFIYIMHHFIFCT